MKFKLFRYIALIAVIAAAALTSVSCGRSAAADESTAAEDTSGAVLEEKILLFSENGSGYSLVRPDGASGSVIACASRVSEYINGCTEAKIAFSDDWLKDYTNASEPNEILIGFCERDESKQVLDTLSSDGYAVTVAGNKLVIAAHTVECLEKAVEEFINSCTETVTEADGTKSVYLVSTSVCTGTDTSCIFNSENPVSGYKIICDTSDTDIAKIAKTLANKINKSYGFKPEIADASCAESECEIVIGDVNRKICDRLDSLGSSEYVITASGSNILIAGRMSESTVQAVQVFIEKYIGGRCSNQIQYRKSDETVGTYAPFPVSNLLTEGADVRVMSFNLLCELWDSQAQSSYEERTETASLIMTYYSPDVIGVQEVSDKWYGSLKRLVGDRYAFTDTLTTSSKTNFSTLLYNTSTVKMLDHGVKVFTQGNNPRLRLTTWAVFEKLSDGKQFIVMSTHWDLGKNTEYQMVHAKEMAAQANKLLEQYNLPLITTGDYNCYENSEPYNLFIKKTGFNEAKYVAKTVNLACKSTHSLGEIPSSAPAYSIDHIFGSQNVEFLYYNVLIDELTVTASDHCPIYADIKLP